MLKVIPRQPTQLATELDTRNAAQAFKLCNILFHNENIVYVLKLKTH